MNTRIPEQGTFADLTTLEAQFLSAELSRLWNQITMALPGLDLYKRPSLEVERLHRQIGAFLALSSRLTAPERGSWAGGENLKLLAWIGEVAAPDPLFAAAGEIRPRVGVGARPDILSIDNITLCAVERHLPALLRSELIAQIERIGCQEPSRLCRFAYLEDVLVLAPGDKERR